MKIATKTLEAIETALQSDQGSSYRKFLKKVILNIGDAYKESDEGFRRHLGASVIGSDCVRSIWYSFRWFSENKFRGRMLRLFNRGHLEEARFIALLLIIGCKVIQQDKDGKQLKISDHMGHYGGSVDGVVLGVPDLPCGQYCLVEFKTHSEKSFRDLSELGVMESKFQHYIQMQQYMLYMQLPVALYMAVNKNTDEIYAELVSFNKEKALQYSDRARKIIESKTPPVKISDSPGFWKCKYCDHKNLCQLEKPSLKNCRTCAHSHPALGGDWVCEEHGEVIENPFQKCDEYQAI